ncbi:Chaperone protein DnaK [Colletotrichum sidae]|uniref:Chaperone protein DnaK n=1 Tax=Colletotrichum sidae TaxID=1347389 RepID=A0A4R8TD00_9PEZI|nr:Chaperone protein DnaK [Colletotrichum sidae]
MPTPADRKTIVIGIDFGTTFSGWCSELNLNSDTEKTPTTLLYGNLQEKACWGYGIPASSADKCLKWFKLLLIDEEDLPTELRKSSQIATARRLLRQCNRDVVEVISSYLRHLWNHSIDCITRSTGKGLLRLCRFHVVVTIPAIWPEYSKARMRRAAEDAGILKSRPAGETVLSFVSEPEAAALATMYDLQCRPDIENGDHFVVCDAGGGTVDLISYEIVSTDPMVVREAVKGDGRLCGGVFLDEAFAQLLREKLGHNAWDAMTKNEAQRVLHNDWEHGIKRQFYGQDKDWIVVLPYNCSSVSGSKGLWRKPILTLDFSDLDPLFYEIAKQIEDLVHEQVQQVQQKYSQTPRFYSHTDPNRGAPFVVVPLFEDSRSSISVQSSQ